jgi:hypothetical protein
MTGGNIVSDAEPRGVSPENIQRQMADIRERLHQHVEDIVEDARTLVDWRHYVREYPWICFGAAAALGLFVVPRRLEIMRPDAETLAQLARQERLVIEPKAQVKKEERGAVGALLAWAGGMLLRTGMQYAGQQLAASFRQSAIQNAQEQEIARSDGSHRARRPR